MVRENEPLFKVRGFFIRLGNLEIPQSVSEKSKNFISRLPQIMSLGVFVQTRQFFLKNHLSHPYFLLIRGQNNHRACLVKIH